MSNAFVAPVIEMAIPGPRERSTPLDGLGVWLVSARESQRPARELSPPDNLPEAPVFDLGREIRELREVARLIRQTPEKYPAEVADRVLRLYGER